MKGICLVLCTGALGLLFAGCTIWQQRSVLDEGVTFGASRHVHHVSTSEALQWGRVAVGSWRGEIRVRARRYPGYHYENLSARVFRTRLHALARRYGFTVDKVSFIRVFRGQVAPKVVVHTTQYLRFAHAIPSIEGRLDPRGRFGRHRTHDSFEAFFFQANDERGIPFLGVFDAVRGPGPGGGQWARSDGLFPYPHG